MAYFTAVVARAGSVWRARDVELDESGTLADVTEALRSVAVGDEPVIAVLEHEDEWFALFRVDGDDEARLFVSDSEVAARSGYAQMLAPAAEVRLPGDEPEPAEPSAEDDEDAAVVVATGAAWAGEPDLLEDLGVSGPALRSLVEEHDDDPGAVIADLGEQVGFAELIEALR